MIIMGPNTCVVKCRDFDASPDEIPKKFKVYSKSRTTHYRDMIFLTDFVWLLFVPGKELSTIWLHLPLIDGYKTEEINKRYQVLIYLGVKIFI